MINSDHVLAVLQHSQALLTKAAAPLLPDAVIKPSYASEWSIAQVLSHLGSGAEIYTRFLVAGSTSAGPPERADLKAIWDDWKAKSPERQVTDSLAANTNFLERVGELTSAQEEDFRVQMFVGEVDLAGFLLVRLGEHAVHTWDVRVALDPTATIPEDAAELLIPRLSEIANRSGKAGDADLNIAVQLTDPDRQLSLHVGADGVRLVDGTLGDATLRLPAEAFVRLIYGRMDAQHTPALEADGVDLDQLRAVFPGF